MRMGFVKSFKFWILFIFALLAFILFVLEKQTLVISLGGENYGNGGELELKLKNYFFMKELCFSTCRPYLLEKKEEVWYGYHYQDCAFPDKIEKCIRPGEKKVFHLSLPELPSATYRIAIPVCDDCCFAQIFQETLRFYSKEFEIK